MGERAILVTGGAGYIGSHLVWALHDRGRAAVVLDSGINSGTDNLPGATPVIRADAGDPEALAAAIRDHGVTQVVHLAASISVPASVADPEGYRRNNLEVTQRLAEVCRATGVSRVVFASTAAVYGDFPEGMASETSPTRPTKPYGAAKLAAEAALHGAGGFQPVVLRFFNASGADAKARSGPDPAHSASLFINAVEAALGRRAHLDIFGTDYPTRDGSAERDNIHIADLTEVLIEVLDAPREAAFPPAMNLGYGHGYTVLEVVQTLERIIGRDLNKRFGPRRPGDPARVIADASLARRTLAWRPRHDNLEDMLRSTLAWRARF